MIQRAHSDHTHQDPKSLEQTTFVKRQLTMHNQLDSYLMDSQPEIVIDNKSMQGAA